MTSQAQPLHVFLSEAKALCGGQVVIGDEGLEVIYDTEDTRQRAAVVRADLIALDRAGFRGLAVGRNRLVRVSLTNVGTAFAARYVK